MIGTGMPFPSADIPVLHLQPQPLAVGIGCKRGTAAEEIQTALRQTLERHDLAPNRIRILASIALKEDEPGLLETARSEGWQTRFFSAGELERIAVPHPSPLVLEKTGSPSVAEAAALAAGDGRLLVAKEKVGAVTLAIATLTEAPDDKKNALLQVVGIGPGTLEGMTRQALEAIRNAKIIIGYQAYCDRIAALLPGKTVLSSGMREEIERCDQALDLAGEGRSVALICSGDAGVYGMAGLLFERIEARGLDFGQVHVIPGVTAASLAAAAVGAPLMNDFAVISLSDLLTDRATILRRLQHAAASGMACALYNPRSEKRRKLIQTALDLFIEERGKNTPGAIVSHAGRTEETLWTGRIADMPVEKIHMSSMVLIGGENCRLIGNRLVEPRGYAKKSGFLEGEGEEG
jgi:cobalt-precorrin 5A hydrolase/precorrin-3B C17-methyltransferase